ncbi:uncharacterized protein LOC108427475 [Pygocentrus nattereri]|uniref:Ig-like domain-containing protein n=1 Tax=Pygocentrus nattereri TaxID=42514 RepID=A0AAR2KYA7_PYGNA|nr:uncharacterized protein LOC108427475 [Pygocentrus nattereri]
MCVEESVVMERLYLLLVVFHFTAGCSLSGDQKKKEHRGYTGGSVLLPCSCTDLQTKPNAVKWGFRSVKSEASLYNEIYPAQTGQHRDRVKLSNKNSGNLSLLISDLSEEDQGDYRCSVGSDFKLINLLVEVFTSTVRETPTDPKKTPTSLPEPPTTDQQTDKLYLGLGILTLLLFLLFGTVTIICWRLRGRRSGQKVTTDGHLGLNRKQENQTVSDDVMYSTIAHSNTATPARVQIGIGEQTEYASIKTN